VVGVFTQPEAFEAITKAMNDVKELATILENVALRPLVIWCNG